MLAIATRTCQKSTLLIYITSLYVSLLEQVLVVIKRLAKEKAEYAKSDAPKLTPSKTNAKELMGWVAATNWTNTGN